MGFRPAHLAAVPVELVVSQPASSSVALSISPSLIAFVDSGVFSPRPLCGFIAVSFRIDGRASDNDSGDLECQTAEWRKDIGDDHTADHRKPGDTKPPGQ